MASGTLSLLAIYQFNAPLVFLDYGVTIKVKAAPAKPNSNAQFGDSIVPEAKRVIVHED